tara:strand:- start:10062 stop:10679 length:618 start_codon:yes stop_codon:yes gene_type:complete
MPFLKDFIINKYTKIKLWKVKLGELDFNILNEDDTDLLKLRKKQLAKEQFLAVRKTLQLENPNLKIIYDKFGRPSLKNSYNISISHSNQIVGIVLSRKNIIGIDIELPRKKIFDIKNKFLSEEEKKYLGDNPALELLTIIWASKESIYKALKMNGVVFSKNIQINNVSYLDRHGSGYYENGDIMINFDLSFFYFKNYIICYSEKK